MRLTNKKIALCLDGDEVSKVNFPLPNLTERLEKCSKILHDGRGFFVLKGIDMSHYTVEDSIVIYLGMASYIADQRGIQDREGNVLSMTMRVISHQKVYCTNSILC